ncbi:Longitudinals lacking protein, isoforms A/B/D/L [Anthophora plagiata]
MRPTYHFVCTVSARQKRFHRLFLNNIVAVWKMLKDLGDGPPFPCPKCGRTYSHKCNLTRHLRLECGVGPRFQCAWCKKRFKHRHHLRDHQRIHLYSNCTFELRN